MFITNGDVTSRDITDEENKKMRSNWYHLHTK